MKKLKPILALCLSVLALLGIMSIGSKDIRADSSQHTVTFNYNRDRVLTYISDTDGSLADSMKTHFVYVADGGCATPSYTPSSTILQYYTYTWTTLDGTEVDLTECEITEDTAFFAKWTPKSFKAYLNYGGVESEITNLISNYTFTIESARINLYTPNRPNYLFVGWYDTPNDLGSKQYLYIAPKSTGDKVLYARFSPIEYYIDYNTEATHNNPRGYNVEDENITLSEPTLYGHIFKGWYSDSRYTTPVTTIDCSKGGNIELYAKWELETYEVTYILPNGLTKMVEVEYGETANLPNINKSIFEIVKTDVSRKNITEDTTIQVRLVNIWYVYVIAIVVIAGTITAIVLVKKKRENTHNTLRNMYYSNSNNRRKY